MTRRNGEPSVELVGYAQPCVARPGDTVNVKVSSTLPDFTAEVVRLGLETRPAVPPVDGRFPGRHQELVSGSSILAGAGRRRTGPRRAHGGAVVLPHLARRGRCLMAGQAGDTDGSWELGVGQDQRVSVVLVAWPGRALPWHIRRPGGRDRALVPRGSQLGRRRLDHPGCPAPRHPRRRRPGRRLRRDAGRRRAA